jgi:hypothetical protein
MLVSQLRPGATLETVKIYADRLKMSPEEFEDRLQDNGWIKDQVFAHVPVEEVQAILDGAVPDCVELISSYLVVGKHQITSATDASR